MFSFVARPIRLLAVTMTACAGLAVAESRWAITDLGTLGGGYAVANAINNHGAVVGRSRAPSQAQHAFLWTPRGGMRDLGTLGGATSEAFAINNTGHVVGWSSTAANDTRGFVWTARTGMVDLSTLGAPVGVAFGINDRGDVVGQGASAGTYRAFRWSAARGTVWLATLGGENAAVAVNEVGQAAGWGLTASGAAHACLWKASGAVVDLGTLGGSASLALALNDRGQVTGWSDTADGVSHAFVWSAGTGMRDLGTLTGAGNSYGRSISAHGLVVGTSDTRGFVWSPNEGMTALEGLGGLSGSGYPNGINDAGRIAGVSWTPAGEDHAVVWASCAALAVLDAAATPAVLWPVNHALVRVAVAYRVRPGCSRAVTTSLTAVSDEPDRGRGRGHADRDVVVVNDHLVLLRAERAADGDGRAYTITIHAVDALGDEATADVVVTVPKHRGWW